VPTGHSVLTSRRLFIGYRYHFVADVQRSVIQFMTNRMRVGEHILQPTSPHRPQGTLADPLSADSMLTAAAGAEISAPKAMQYLPNESLILMLLHNHVALQVLHINEGQHRFGELSKLPVKAQR
jgi:hypothetical protein